MDIGIKITSIKSVKNADNQKELKIVYDQIGTPTIAISLANAIEKVLDKPAGEN